MEVINGVARGKVIPGRSNVEVEFGREFYNTHVKIDGVPTALTAIELSCEANGKSTLRMWVIERPDITQEIEVIGVFEGILQGVLHTKAATAFVKVPVEGRDRPHIPEIEEDSGA